MCRLEGVDDDTDERGIRSKDPVIWGTSVTKKVTQIHGGESLSEPPGVKNFYV